MIHTMRAHVHVAAYSHEGRVRKNNEDNYAVSAFQVSEADPTPSVFAILSDGIGGHKAGEVASELVVNGISLHVARSDALNPMDVLRQAFDETNQRVVQESQSGPEKNGMGATLVCTWLIGNHLYTATAGDSRIYMARGGAIRKISVDHTWVQEAVERGVIPPEMAAKHPNAHVIRRYLGSAKPVEPDFRMRLVDGESDEQSLSNQGVLLQPGDVLVLCSDGLTDLVSDKEILETMLKANGIKAAASSLVDLACERGGHDNVTVVILMMPWDAEKQEWFKRA